MKPKYTYDMIWLIAFFNYFFGIKAKPLRNKDNIWYDYRYQRIWLLFDIF